LNKAFPLDEGINLNFDAEIIDKISKTLGYKHDEIIEAVRIWTKGESSEESNPKVRDIGLAYVLWLSESKKKKNIISSRTEKNCIDSFKKNMLTIVLDLSEKFENLKIENTEVDLRADNFNKSRQVKIGLDVSSFNTQSPTFVNDIVMIMKMLPNFVS
jgi:hypothetical protein